MEKAIEVLELLRPAVQSAEAFAVTSESVKVGYKAGKVRSSEVQESSGVSVRVINEGKLGFYATTDMTDLEHLKNSALNSAKYGGDATFEFATPASGESFEGFNQETARMDIAELADLSRRLTAKVEEVGAGVMVECEVERTTYTQHLVNSNGVDIKQRRSVIGLSVVAQRVQGDDVFFTYNGTQAIGYDQSFEQLTDKILEQLRLSEKLVKMDTREGELPVIFTPVGGYILFLPLMLGLAGKNAHLGVSPLAHKLNMAVLDPRITVVDEPIVPNSAGSAAYDDEGIPTKQVAFFDKGELKSFYYDLKTAGEAGVKTTGHAHRGLLGQPGAGMHNPMVLPGDVSFKDMISDIKEGLLVESVLGMGQTNIMAGEFSNPVSTAFKIENGEVVGRVKDVSIAGNVYDLLKDKVAAVSSELESVFGQLRMPYIRIDGVSTVASN